jgi:hypothetical protein
MCEHCIDHADRIASGVEAMVDDDDSPMEVAEQIANTFVGINAVEVLDAEGNGGLVYPEWP